MYDTIIGSELNQSTQKNRIFSVNEEDLQRRWLTSESDNCITPSWKNDSETKYIYVVITSDNVPWITDYNNTRITSGLHPAYSPDGTEIVFTTLPTPGVRSEVAILKANGQVQVLTHTTVADRQGWVQSLYGTFSPDGSKIVYSSSQGGSLQIWTMKPDGSDKRQLTSGSTDANAPSWSPDGSRVAYFCGQEGARGTIYVHDGTTARKLLTTSTTANSDNPAWSPDSEWICFESDRPVPGETNDPRTRRSRTWAIRPDGTDLRILLPYGYGAGRKPWTTNA